KAAHGAFLKWHQNCLTSGDVVCCAGLPGLSENATPSGLNTLSCASESPRGFDRPDHHAALRSCRSASYQRNVAQVSRGAIMTKLLLARGARGELVRKVQLALTNQGFDPKGVDGTFGKDTEASIKTFQQDRGLEPSGHVDLDTWTKLLGIRIPT